MEDCKFPREPLGGAALDARKVQAPERVCRAGRSESGPGKEGLLPLSAAPADKAAARWLKPMLWGVQDVNTPA